MAWPLSSWLYIPNEEMLLGLSLQEKLPSRKGVYIMIIRKDIDLNTPLTAAQAEMLEALADRPVTPDEDP